MWTKDNKPWIILNESFTSRTAVMARLRTIAEKNNWRAPGLHELNKEDEAFVLAFFSQHSAIEDKIGGGVKRLLVGSSRVLDASSYNNWCFFFETHGREQPIDIGAKSCFETFTKLDDFQEACYTAISPRSTAVLNRDFGDRIEMECPETGDLVTRRECYVAHCSPSMREIMQRFIQHYRLDIDQVNITGDTRRTFSDDSLSRRFFDFHGDVARMRVVGRQAFYKRLQANCSAVPLARASTGV